MSTDPDMVRTFKEHLAHALALDKFTPEQISTILEACENDVQVQEAAFGDWNQRVPDGEGKALWAMWMAAKPIARSLV